MDAKTHLFEALSLLETQYMQQVEGREEVDLRQIAEIDVDTPPWQLDPLGTFINGLRTLIKQGLDTRVLA